MLIFYVILTVIASMPIWYPHLFRWVFFPSRKPDFEHRLYTYWFEEKVAYGRLATKKRVRFYEHRDGCLYDDNGNNIKFIEELDKLPIEVQQAYKNYLQKKFEEIVLS